MGALALNHGRLKGSFGGHVRNPGLVDFAAGLAKPSIRREARIVRQTGRNAGLPEPFLAIQFLGAIYNISVRILSLKLAVDKG